MIPGVNSLKELEVKIEPSLGYKMELDGMHVAGMCDGKEAMKQVIFCILNTERYQYPVYSFRYGVELKDLFGRPADYVMSELKGRITEALIQDDRITSVDNFEFDTYGKTVEVTFTVHTVFGGVSGKKRWN